MIVILPFRALTPWKEKYGQGSLLWWSGAEEAGIHEPMP
jgi:hypothetical protein